MNAYLFPRELNFVYGVDRTGTPAWTNTTADQLQDWSDTEWSWQRTRNLDEVLGSTKWKFADALLSGHNDICDNVKCSDAHASLKTLNASEWGPCTSCLTRVFKQPDIFALQNRIDLSVEQLAIASNAACSDLVSLQVPGILGDCNKDDDDDDDSENDYHWNVDCWNRLSQRIALVNVFSDAAGKETSCANGCPDLTRPLCKAGNCVQPTCEDAYPHCGSHSATDGHAREGQAARMYAQFVPADCKINA